MAAQRAGRTRDGCGRVQGVLAYLFGKGTRRPLSRPEPLDMSSANEKTRICSSTLDFGHRRHHGGRRKTRREDEDKDEDNVPLCDVRPLSG